MSNATDLRMFHLLRIFQGWFSNAVARCVTTSALFFIQTSLFTSASQPMWLMVQWLATDVKMMESVHTSSRPKSCQTCRIRHNPVSSDAFESSPGQASSFLGLRCCHTVGIVSGSDWFCPHGCLNRKVAQVHASRHAEPLPADDSYGSVRAHLRLRHGVVDSIFLRHAFKTCCPAIHVAYSSAFVSSPRLRRDFYSSFASDDFQI